MPTAQPGPEPAKETTPASAVMSINKACFYFDVSDEQSQVVSVLANIMPRLATFLDKTVTHLVTDKATTIVEAHANTIKWQMTVLSLPQFLLTVLINMERTGDQHFAAFKRMVHSRGRDLNQCLEEERQASTKMKPARMTPMYAAGKGNAAALTAPGGKITTVVKPVDGEQKPVEGEQKPVEGAQKPAEGAQKPAEGEQKPAEVEPKPPAKFKAFTAPFVMIEERNWTYASIIKEYPPGETGRATFPVIRWDGPAPHCPFSYNTRARLDGKYWSDLGLKRAPVAPVDRLTVNVKRVPAPRDVGAATTAAPAIVPAPALRARPPQQQGRRASFGGDPAKRPSVNPKARPGYCECCNEMYEQLLGHVQSEKHRAFAAVDANYELVDSIVEQLFRVPLVDSTYNPILAWGYAKVTLGAGNGHMSPAHSTILSQCTRKSGFSGLRAAHVPLPATLEDKENDSPSGLDLTGFDKGYLAEKRHVLSGDQISSDVDVFQDPAKRKMRRIGLKL